ncbi:MAG: endolytic transglycosylase MltG [Clostridia bacterium]|nr:endolytic transglycosylase MltG [Clostridia bacterium]
MKMRLRIISSVLAAAAVISLAACSGKDDNDTTGISGADTTQLVQIYGESENNYTPDNGDETTLKQQSNSSQDTQKSENSQGTTEKLNDSQQAPETPGSSGSAERETVRITIPEGFTLTQVFKRLEANGVCSFDELMSTSQSYDYSYYPLIAARPNKTRAFKLEGYLFPNTYDFYKGERPQDAIGRFLRVAESQITSSHRSKAKAMGYSMDEILTVASIIEKEGSNASQVSKIAAVIYNRLEAGMKLQMDSGIYYIEDKVKPYLTGDINRYNSLYNMYKCSGLPAGPICNPGMKTINAALNPADVPYLYFCHDENANYYYAETYEEHLENLKKAGIES